MIPSLGAASQFAETHRTFLTLIAAGTISTFYLGGTFSGQKSDLKHETEQRKLEALLTKIRSDDVKQTRRRGHEYTHTSVVLQV